MKKITLFLICFSFFFSTKAQFFPGPIGPGPSNQNSAYANRMDHIFGNIDKSKVTTGYLKEFGIRFANIEACDGNLSTSNFVTKSEWQAMYNSLYSMRVGTVAMGMTSPQSVNNNLKTQQDNSNDILLVAQHYNYQQYKTNAVSNNDVTISGDRIYDVNGRNPYDTKTLFAVAPIKQYLKGNNFTFKLQSNLLYTNTGLFLNLVQIDFDDGNGYQSVSFNNAKSVTYNFGGEKELKVKFMYSNGTTVESHSKILVQYASQTKSLQSRFNGSGANEILITGAPWNGSAAVGKITYELASGHTALTKPLIVIEGFDFGDSFDFADSFDYFSLVQSLGGGPGNLNINIGSLGTLNQAIENEGYDLVFVDFANSTDFIQRNAYMVEEVIRWVNGEKVGNEKNAVLGMSMGGLVGRYALRHMEINGETHETELYISHDSPHQGANIPLSVQALLRHLIGEEISLPVFFSLFDITIVDLEDQIPGLTDALSLLESPAAQQMLIYQLQGTGTNVSIDNSTLHNSFSIEYKNMGLPQQGNIRNIAITNGTECGTPLDFNPHDHLIDANIRVDLPFFITNIALAIVNGISVNPLKRLSSILSTDTDIKAQFELRALPSLQNRQIYKGEVFIEKTVLFVIDVEEPLIDEETVNSSSSMLALDNANGGILDIEEFLDSDELPPGLEQYILQSRFNFIPIHSGLDVGSGNVTITPADLVKIYNPLSPPVAPKDVPFDNFFSNPIVSEVHTQFTSNNGNWLRSELAGTPIVSSCAYVCDGVQISGSDFLCLSNQYSVQASVPSDVIVTWSVSNTNAVSLSNTVGTSTTLTTPANTYRTDVVLTATISSAICQNTTSITKTIRVGKPGLPAYLNGPTVVNTGALANYNAGVAQGATSYEWRLPYPFGVSNPIDYFNQDWQMAPTNHRNLTAMTGYAGNSGAVQVSGVNQCGTGGARMLQVVHGNGGPGGGGIPRAAPQGSNGFSIDSKYFEVYPNPSKGIVNINLTNYEHTPLNQESIQGELFDLLGKVTKTVTISNNRASVNTSDLKTGIYILKIYVDDTIENHKISVE